MRRACSLGVVLIAVVMSSGCPAYHGHGGAVPVPTCVVPDPVIYRSDMLFQPFHVQANASTEISGGDAAFAVTANGAGTYRLTWSDTNGQATCFTGLVTAFNDFSANQVTGLSGHEAYQLVAPNQIAFASVPGLAVDGIDFFASKAPIYVDVAADRSPNVNIYYSDSQSGVISLTGVNPAAFYSP